MTANWADLKDTLPNPTIYTVNSVEKHCSILGTQVALVHVVRDAWTNKLTVVRTQILNQDN